MYSRQDISRATKLAEDRIDYALCNKCQLLAGAAGVHTIRNILQGYYSWIQLMCLNEVGGNKRKRDEAQNKILEIEKNLRQFLITGELYVFDLKLKVPVIKKEIDDMNEDKFLIDMFD